MTDNSATPAEHGQERWWVWRKAEDWPWGVVATPEGAERAVAAGFEIYEVVLAAERDEAVKREKALREALQEIADTNGWEFANVLADKARAALDQSGKP